MRERYVAAIDQGTASSRCLVFDRSGRIVSVAQKEHPHIFPRPGWVEHDPEEIWRNVEEVVARALGEARLEASDLVALGIANQRESTVVWDRQTGQAVHNAINWQDMRTDHIVRALDKEHGQDFFRERSGLPPATYFSGPKLMWLLDTIDGLRERAEAGEVLFGTMDSWLIWRLTGRHLTDLTNASRTMLMNLHTLDWDRELLAALGVPRAMLPEIRSSAEVYGDAGGQLAGVPVAAALGDQQAALFGQTCFSPGEAKCTYGTGSFLLMNTGERPVPSSSGLLTTLACRVGDEPPTYALEGSIAVTGALVQWFRDNLTLIGSAPEIETLARTVEDNGGCYFVPAFSGLFAPHWRSDARGVIAGLTSYITKGHLARAVLEATAWQTREVVEAMISDAGVPLSTLRVDGGMTANNLLMQFLADVLDVSVVRPMVAETVSLGAAYAAGLAVGFWSDTEVLRANWHMAAQWLPDMDSDLRERGYRKWRKAVALTTDWLDDDDD
ncbi:MAG TPA: glycerol kinase GlpK [Solirubrobacteraceae bacterium]|jgi:glycerol kinase|nr:glycerol kinase GlpK [Solirubrobacteraceae bacterium]